MRLLVLSDLHYDFWAESGRDPFVGLEDVFASLDHLVLAGDLSNKPKVRWKYAFNWLSRYILLDKISVFPGNHDFYDFRIDGEPQLRQIAQSFGAHYAQKSVLRFENLRLLCATLWTDLKLGPGIQINESNVRSRMNDYRKIRHGSLGFRRIMPADLAILHREHRSWLEEQLALPFAGRTVVATHHAPHPDVLGDHSGGLDAAYASDLGELICQYQPDLWTFGHCHDASDAVIGKTRLVNTALGYPEEVADPEGRIRSLVLDL